MQTVSRWGTRSVGIAVKILAVVGLLAIAAATIAGAGIHAIQVYSIHVQELRRAAERAIAGEPGQWPDQRRRDGFAWYLHVARDRKSVV